MVFRLDGVSPVGDMVASELAGSGLSGWLVACLVGAALLLAAVVVMLVRNGSKHRRVVRYEPVNNLTLSSVV